MARSPANNKFQIPAILEPTNMICFQLLVPDEPTHIANLQGALAQLGYGNAYPNDAAHSAATLSAYWTKLLWGILFVPCDGRLSGCVAYPPYDGSIVWNPRNPFYRPTDIPTGYVLPPMEVVQPGGVLTHLGYQAGDVLTELYRLPPGSLPTILPPDGLPRFRFNFVGAGHVEITLLNIIQGGYALIEVDADLASVQLVNLEINPASIPESNSIDHIVAFDVTGIGDHFIDVTFVPFVDDSAEPVHYGGGLRSIEICGGQATANTPGNGIDLDEDDLMSEFMQVITVNGKCLLQYRCCPEDPWITVATTTDVPSQTTQPGAGSPLPAPGGGTQQYCNNLNADGELLLPFVVNTGDILTLDSADGAGAAAGELRWNCFDGKLLFGDACQGFQTTVGTDPLPGVSHMALIYHVGTNFYDATAGPVTLPVGVVNEQVTIQVNNSVLAGNRGSYAVCVTVTNNAQAAWVHDVLLTLSPRGLTPRDMGAWTAGVGFTDTTVTYGATIYRGTDIQFVSPAAFTLTELGYYAINVPGSGGSQVGIGATTPGVYIVTPALIAGDHFYTTGPINLPGTTHLFWDNILGAVSMVDPGGSAQFYKVRVAGKGFDPFAGL